MVPSSGLLVLDTHGILAYLLNEPGGVVISELLALGADGVYQILVSAMSVAETAYTIQRRRGQEAVVDSLALLDELPLEIVDLDRKAVLQAARIKASHPISLGDAFVAALAAERGAVVVTGDREFQRVEHLVEVFWLAQKGPSDPPPPARSPS